MEKLFRIDVIDEETGMTIQSMKGIPARKLQLVMSAFGYVGSLVRDFQAVREVLRRRVG